MLYLIKNLFALLKLVFGHKQLLKNPHFLQIKLARNTFVNCKCRLSKLYLNLVILTKTKKTLHPRLYIFTTKICVMDSHTRRSNKGSLFKQIQLKQLGQIHPTGLSKVSIDLIYVRGILDYPVASSSKPLLSDFAKQMYFFHKVDACTFRLYNKLMSFQHIVPSSATNTSFLKKLTLQWPSYCPVCPKGSLREDCPSSTVSKPGEKVVKDKITSSKGD